MGDRNGPFFGQKWTTLQDFAYKISTFSGVIPQTPVAGQLPAPTLAQSGVGAGSCDPRCFATPSVLGRRHQFPFGSPAFPLFLPVLRNDH